MSVGGGETDWVHSVRRPLFDLLYQPRMIADDDKCWAVGGMSWQGKPKYSEKTCPSATFFATHPTWPDLGSNSATNRLSYGKAYVPL
jgi:hypothetical protein